MASLINEKTSDADLISEKKSELMPHDYESAVRVAKIINKYGFEVFVIGGAVRDLWLGREPKDFDLVTNATPDQIINISEFRTARYKDLAQAFGITRVRVSHGGIDHEFEVATFRKDIEAHLGRKATKVEFSDLESDVLRRDFTINALALDLSTNQVIDYVDGIDDLTDKCIRFIGSPKQRISEDPLRIMRAIRFKNHLNFSYHPQTIKAIKSAVKNGYIQKIAVDRLRDELNNLLIHPSRRNSLYDLNEFGILDIVLPEVTAGKFVSQSYRYHAEGNVWNHELLIMDYLPQNTSKRLVWAALLHDIGKGPTKTITHHGLGHFRFRKHYAVGSEMARVILHRLRFSNRDIDDITWMIYNHMSIDDLPSMRPSHQQQMLGNPAFEDLLELHRADAASSWRPNVLHRIRPKFRKIEKMWHLYKSTKPEYQQPSLKRDLKIDGNWLLDNFKDEFRGLEGPIIGVVLEKLNEWYRDNGTKDVNVYFKKARQLIKKEIKSKK